MPNGGGVGKLGAVFDPVKCQDSKLEAEVYEMVKMRPVAQNHHSLCLALPPWSSFIHSLLRVDPGSSQTSCYTSLGLFVISVPGIWSLVKRSTKSNVEIPLSVECVGSFCGTLNGILAS